MSDSLLNLAKNFALHGDDAIGFAEKFMDSWKNERDANRLVEDPPLLSETLSTIFCFADLFNPDNDREEYELSEEELQSKVRLLLQEGGFL